jgi:tripartite-type tricarboxylate transporter receptor subunit TctC
MFRQFFNAAVLGFCMAANAAPKHPIELIVPFAPGGMSGNTSSVFAKLLSEHLGQPITVRYYPGRHAQEGARHVAKSSPDGRTLLAITVAHSANATLMPDARYDLQRDLKGIAFLTAAPLVAVVSKKSPIQSLQDLVVAAKKSPLQVGTSGNGSPPHLTMALFDDLTDTQSLPIPHAGGKIAIESLIAGKVDAVFANISEIIEPLRAGHLRALAITSSTRHPLLPDVPTSAEAGMPGLMAENWGAIMAPRGTPPETIAHISDALKTIASKPATQKLASDMGLSIRFVGHQDFEQHLLQDIQKWQNLIKKHNITPGWVK